MGKQCQTLFLGAPKSLQMVTAAMKLKDAYSFEEKLGLVMTDLDSTLKSRDITLPTVVTYGCESWTVKKLSTKELMLLNCGVGEDS